MDLKTVENELTADAPSSRNWRLAHTIAQLERVLGMGIWEDWTQLEDFPIASSSIVDRYAFLDNYLCKLLSRKPHPRRPNYFRPDLNGRAGSNRAWLMKTIFQRVISNAEQLLADKKAPGGTAPYKYPGDLPAVIKDIHVLQTHNSKMQRDLRSLTGYKTAEALGDAVKKWRPRHTISEQDHRAAHRKFLQSDDYKGDGGASLIALLEDGSEVLHILSQEAAIAYGSPHWCVSKEKTSNFNDYKQGLIFIISAEGERWGIHFGIGDFVDSDDTPIVDFPAFVNSRKGLAALLEPYLTAASKTRPMPRSLLAAAGVPLWRQKLSEHLDHPMRRDFQLWYANPKEQATRMQPDMLRELNSGVNQNYSSYWLECIIEYDSRQSLPILRDINPYHITSERITRLRDRLLKDHAKEFCDIMQQPLVDAVNAGRNVEKSIEWLLLLVQKEQQRTLSIMQAIKPSQFCLSELAGISTMLWGKHPQEYLNHTRAQWIEGLNDFAIQHRCAAWLLKFIKHNPHMALSILSDIKPGLFGARDVAPLRDKLYELYPREYANKMQGPLINEINTTGSNLDYCSHWLLEFIRHDPSRAFPILRAIDPSHLRDKELFLLQKKFIDLHPKEYIAQLTSRSASPQASSIAAAFEALRPDTRALSLPVVIKKPGAQTP